MKSTRIKLTAPSLKSRVEADAAVAHIRDLTIQRNQRLLIVELEKKRIDDHHGPVLAELEKTLEEKTEVLRAWAEANPSEFGDRKSLDTPHGTLGWRLGNVALKCLSGWTWDRVLEKLRSTPAFGHYVRTKDEVDKQSLLADRETLGPESLRAIGVRVNQDEPFFVEPKVEEPENRQTA